MNLIFLGPPGSGKGTQAKLLAEKLKLNHISSGRLLRDASKGRDKKSQTIKAIMNRGELVPFDTILDLIAAQIKKSPRGFILDGTPRDLAQAEHIDWFFNKEKITLSRVVFFDLSDKQSLSRLFGRAKKGSRLDDKPEVIKDRIKIYHQQTEPLIEYYNKKGQLIIIDASPNIEKIHQAILAALKI